MKLITVDQMESTRRVRAAEQAASYEFRLVAVPCRRGSEESKAAVVYVTSPAGTVYSVHGGRCNCPDFQRRSQLHAAAPACKHVHMAQAWMDGQQLLTRQFEQEQSAAAMVEAAYEATDRPTQAEEDRSAAEALATAAQARRERVARNISRDFPED